MLCSRQSTCAETPLTPALERRRDRIPPLVRFLWRAAVLAPAARGASLRVEARRQLQAFVAARERAKLHAAIRAGRSVFRDPALRQLCGLTTAGEGRDADAAAVGPSVAQRFSAAWRANGLAATAILRYFLSSSHGSVPMFSPDEIEAAWPRLARRTLCDDASTCVDHLRALSQARPQAFAVWLGSAAGSETFWRSLTISGRVYGKTQSWPTLGQLRAILPMPPVMQLLEVILARRLQTFISEALPPVPKLCVGAVPGSQVMDIAHCLQLLMERFLDDRSSGGLAQGGLACY